MSNGIHHDGQFVICGGSVQYWIGTNAKTLTGARPSPARRTKPQSAARSKVAVFHAAQECRGRRCQVRPRRLENA